jgi:hypothetical protein
MDLYFKEARLLNFFKCAQVNSFYIAKTKKKDGVILLTV